MSNKFEEMHIKSRTYYFFDNIIPIKNFDPNKTKIVIQKYSYLLHWIW